MSETTRLVEAAIAAVAAGDDDAVLAALGDVPVMVEVGHDRRAITGDDRRHALDALTASFDQVAVTVVARQARPSGSFASLVLSARHVGQFAGAQPTGRRVRMNLDAVAVGTEQGGVQRLDLTPDLRGLMAQLADSTDSIGIASALVATVRENETAEAAEWELPQVAAEAAPAPPVSRRRTGAVAAVLGVVVLLAAGVVGWRAWSGGAPATTVGAAVTSVPSPTSTDAGRTASASPSPAPSATRPSVPVIATARPSVPPKVQEGKQLVLTSDVLFAFGSSTLTSGARRELLGLAGQIREADVSGTVQVNGYTDDVGTPAGNTALSRARALAVARVLQPALAGMDITLQPQGFGEASPVASNATADGRAKNRRVTVVLPRP